jgi:hypothetical protein
LMWSNVYNSPASNTVKPVNCGRTLIRDFRPPRNGEIDVT